MDLNWTWREMHQLICSSYPSVGLEWIGFTPVKADKYGRLCRINVNTMKKLKKELGESVLYIIPDKDIVLNEVGICKDLRI